VADIGYGRVSSNGQSLEIQEEKLKHCDRVFLEKKSGLNIKREELSKCLDFLREGDTLWITRIDRLARSLFHLCQITDLLKQKGVDLKVIDQNIDTTKPTGKLMFQMLGSFAEFEATIRAERQADGLAQMRKKGRSFGPRTLLTYDEIMDLRKKREDGVVQSELMSEYNISKSTLYKYFRMDLENKKIKKQVRT